MNLKGLVHRELGEGMTEAELASAVKIPVRVILDILSDRPPQDPKVWDAFGKRSFAVKVEDSSIQPLFSAKGRLSS